MSTNPITTDLRSTAADRTYDPSSFAVTAPGLWYAYGVPGASFAVVDLSGIDAVRLADAPISDLELKIAQAHLDHAQSVIAAAMHRRSKAAES